MTNEEIKRAYATTMKEKIGVRRYTGVGVNRPRFDVTVRGNSRLYKSEELIGTIQQGDQQVLLLVEDLIREKITLPLTSNDKIVLSGKELAILAPNTRTSLDGTLIVYDCQARG